MAKFNVMFNQTIHPKGGYAKYSYKGDGEVYKGINRKAYPDWKGWILIDLVKTQLTFPANLDYNILVQDEVISFYQINFWDKMNGDKILNQNIADTIFEYAINVGLVECIKYTRYVLNIEPGEEMDNAVINGLNNVNADFFISEFLKTRNRKHNETYKMKKLTGKYFTNWYNNFFESV
ncbi:MAG: glycosyl hydrolase 108 family protein [Bacteroidota bacterium]